MRLAVGLAEVVPERKGSGMLPSGLHTHGPQGLMTVQKFAWSKTTWRNVTVVFHVGKSSSIRFGQHFKFHHLWEQALTWQVSCTCLRVMHQVLSFLRCHCSPAFRLPVDLQTAKGFSVSWVLAFTGPPKTLSSPKRPRMLSVWCHKGRVTERSDSNYEYRWGKTSFNMRIKHIKDWKHSAATRCNLVQALHKPVEMFPFRPRKQAWWQQVGMQRLSAGQPPNFSNPSRRFGWLDA